MRCDVSAWRSSGEDRFLEEAIEVAEDVTRPLDPEVTMEMLRPRFAYRLGRFVQYCMDQGHDVALVEGYRTKGRQRYLFAIGRTIERKGPVVTHTLESEHCKGRAMDVCSPTTGWMTPALFEFFRVNAGRFGLRTLSGDRGHLEEVK